MAAFDRSEANKAMLQQTEDTQRLTKEAVGRIKNQIGETEVIANATLEQLREQGAQMDNINMDVIAVQQKLDTASKLQDSFDNWSGSWFGGKKRAATREAAEINAQRVAEELVNVTEVFENEKYDRLRRVWKVKPMTLCSDPTVPAHDPFDPKEQLASATSRWAIDFSLVGIDSEGWTYAYDFPTLNKTGAGVPASAWNTYVRRRKWKLVGRGSNSVVDGVKERSDKRATTRPQSAGNSQAEKIGYVPRAKVGEMKESGYSSRGGRKGEALDDESRAGLERVKATDADIDQDLDSINHSLASLGSIAGQMRDEAIQQNKKLEMLDENMGRASDKQTVVNSRQKRYLS